MNQVSLFLTSVLALICTFNIITSQEIGDVEIVYSWVIVDFTWESEADREEAIATGAFVPENVIPCGIKIYNGEVYLTAPRFFNGVPSTLNKVVTVDGVPTLQPFPSWGMQEPDNCDAMQFIQSMEIDPNTGYMWAIDTGRRDILNPDPVNACPAKLLIFDLLTNQTVDVYEFPASVVNPDENYLNDIVLDPAAGFAYISDTGYGPNGFYGGIIVYDHNAKTSHRLEDPSMLPEPGADQMEIGGEMFSLVTPVNGITLSSDKTQLQYSAIAGYTMYQLPTEIARQPGVLNISSSVRNLGLKISQSDGMIMGVKNLYYGALAGVFDSSAAYWPYRQEMDEQGVGLDEVEMTEFVIQYQNYTTLEWPDTFALDDGWLYVVSNRANNLRNYGFLWGVWTQL